MHFEYDIPTKIIFGKKAVLENSGIFPLLGKRVLIVTGKNSSKLNGSLDDVQAVLEKEGVKFFLYDSVEPNPSIETIQQGAKNAREFGADFVIGLGGGSPLDAAKAIAVLTHNELSGPEIFSGPYLKKILPNIAIPTTAGTGSEVTQYSIITDQQNHQKRNLCTEAIFPKYALLDPKYTYGLSAENTINTALDALSHLLESCLSRRSIPYADAIALEGINILGKTLPQLKEELSQRDRESLLYASMLGGVAISRCGTTAIHAMGYPLTTCRGIDHGRANALLMHAYLDFVSQAQSEKVQIIYDALSMTGSEFKGLLDALLGEKEIFSADEIKAFAEFAVGQANIKSTNPEPGLADVMGIYTKSFLH